MSALGRFASDACPSACPVCDALRARHLPIGLCGACDHPGGIKADSRRYRLLPVPDPPGEQNGMSPRPLT